MDLSRRSFFWTSTAFGAMCTMTACPLSNVYDSINKYIPVGLLAFDRVLQIIGEAGVDTAPLLNVSNAVKASLADIQSAILEYRDASADRKDTLVAIIRTALSIAEGRIQDLWSNLTLPPATGKVVKQLLGIIISTLAGFREQLPGYQGNPGPMTAANHIQIEAKVRTIAEFREEFDSVLALAGETKFAI